jgi:biopolymer transport protein TolR
MIRQGRQRKRALADINIVPYIDVMLVLLVIFMIATPLLTQGVKVDLPHTKAAPIKTEQQIPLIVTVDAEGHYFLNTDNDSQTELTAQQLAIRVAAEIAIAKQSGQERQVLVKGDQAVNYGKVVQAMAVLQKAGVPRVGLMTQDVESASHN